MMNLQTENISAFNYISIPFQFALFAFTKSNFRKGEIFFTAEYLNTKINNRRKTLPMFFFFEIHHNTLEAITNSDMSNTSP